MAHQVVEPQLTQTAGGTADPDVETDTGNTLEEFRKCAAAMCHVLYQDRHLNEAEFVFMDTHFQVLEMAYLRWKRKHKPKD